MAMLNNHRVIYIYITDLVIPQWSSNDDVKRLRNFRIPLGPLDSPGSWAAWRRQSTRALGGEL